MLFRKKPQKTISTMLALAFAFGLTLPALTDKAFAADPEVFTLVDTDSNGTLSKAEIDTQLPDGGTYSVKLPSVTTIEASAFSHRTGLVAIDLPEGLTEIPEFAFYACSKLESIAIPDSVTAIGDRAFENCTKLESITFNATSQLDSIGLMAFRSCESLTSFTFPNSVTSVASDNMSDRLFTGCTSLTTVTMGTGLTAIPDGLFQRISSLKSVALASTTQSIGTNAFSESGITSITIPDSVTAIGNNAFFRCFFLKDIALASAKNVSTPEMTIGGHAFAENPVLTSIDIPDKVTSIGSYAFSNCPKLTQPTLASEIEIKSPALTIGESAFTSSGLTAVDIPDRVISIGSGAFSYNESLKTVKLGSSSSASQLETIGNNAFFFCSSLEGITIPDRISKIDAGLFANCESLKSITLGSGCKIDTIGDSAFFNCKNLSSFVIPSTVTTIENDAFMYADKITEFAIPAAVTSIGDGAFGYCDSLTKLTVEDGNINYVADNSVLFNAAKTKLMQYPAGLPQPTYTIPATVSTIGESSFSGSKINTIVIPAAVTDIGEGAFSYCAKLETVTFDTGSILEQIRSEAFSHNEKLKAIEIPASVVNIESDAFYNDAALTEVTFSGEALTTIGRYAFSNCPSIESITIPKGVSNIENDILSGCFALKNLEVHPDNTNYIAENGALYTADKEYLLMYALASDRKTFEVPASISIICHGALIGAKNLESVTVADSNGDYKSIDGVLYSKDESEIIYYPLANKNTDFTIKSTVSDVNEELFNNCKYLLNINVESGNEENSSKDGVLLYYAGEYLRVYPSARTADTYIIPSDVVEIGDNAFVNCKNLKNVVAQNSLDYFDSESFRGSDVKLYLMPGSKAIESADINGIKYTTKPFLGLTSVSSPTSTGATINFTTNQMNSSYYYIVFKATENISPPDKLLDIQKAAAGVSRGNGVSAIENTFNVAGLSPSTEYIAYLIVSSNTAGESEIVALPFTTAAGSGGGGATPSTPKVTTITTGTGANATTTAATDISGTTAGGKQTVTVPNDTMTGLTDAAKTAESTGGKAVASINTGSGAGLTNVGVTIPGAQFNAFASGTRAALQIKSGLGSITFPSGAVDKISAAGTGDVTINIESVDKSALSAAKQKLVGSRPVYSFSVLVGSTKVSEFGSSVTVTLPYTLGSNENPNAIVVYYIDASGALKPMQGKYDAKTGTVTFKTSHFSEYMIGYNKLAFNDVPSTAWYAEPVTFISARSITTGTGDSNFSPEAKLTRGQFLVMLMRAYGISADQSIKDNFADAGDTYYTAYLATAKKIKITTGVGNNLFAPDNKITRQEMFTLLYNTLKQLGELPTNTSGKTLADFSDAGDIASWAKEAITLFVGSGTVAGSDGKLSPRSTTTRAEMAKILYNLLAI